MVELTASFASPTSLRLGVYATYFPSFAVRVYKAAPARARSVRFRLKSHQSKAIVLRLSAASRRALRRKHRLAARVAIRVVDGAGKSGDKTIKLRVIAGHR